MIKRLKKERFNLVTLGSFSFQRKMLYEEKSYWSNTEETVIGFIIYDKIDQDYGYGILMRDKIGRFRLAYGDVGILKEKFAKKHMRSKMLELSKIPISEQLFAQGDEPNKYIDLLKVTKKIPESKLHPYFIQLTRNLAYRPAMKVIRELSPWIQPKDRHLEKEFQTSQFDQRIWEIYLWAALKELMFDVEQLEAPDFLCKMEEEPLFTIEATTVAPSTSGVLSQIPDEPKDKKSLKRYNNGYMTIKFGSSLTSKLNKQPTPYWEMPDATNLPLVIAIADFHRSGDGELPSMGYTHSALAPYLYGFESLVVRTKQGKYEVQSTPIKKHKYLDKEIPSGFFNLPNAENISAILFCNTGTIAKFNRMGVLAGFGETNFKYIREGMKYNVSDPVATEGVACAFDIQSAEYNETWSEELHLFHNPNARYPLHKNFFRNINQHFSKGNYLESEIYPTWIYSHTNIIKIIDE